MNAHFLEASVNLCGCASSSGVGCVGAGGLGGDQECGRNESRNREGGKKGEEVLRKSRPPHSSPDFASFPFKNSNQNAPNSCPCG